MADTDQRIGLFLPNLSGGGAERTWLRLAESFADTGRTVDLVLGAAEGELADDVPDTVNLVVLDYTPVPGYEFLGAVPGMVRYYRTYEPTAVLSGLHRANIVAIVGAKIARADTRVVVSERNHLSTYLEYAPYRERVALPFLIRTLYPMADHITTGSMGVADDLAERTGIPREHITAMYNPTVTPRLHSLRTEPVSHPLFERDGPVVLGVGSLSEQKDFATLLRAFARLDTEPDASLLILGDGERRGRLESVADELGLGQQVRFEGFVDNPYAYMSRSDLFVLTSRWEGLPNVLIEAMACGCPVVATDCPSGPSEILENGTYGPLVPVGDDRTLAQAMQFVLSNPTDSGKLQDRAEDFSLEKISQRYLNLLLE